MARTSPDCPLAGKTWLYHSGQPSAISFQPLGNLDKKERQIGKMGDFDDRRSVIDAIAATRLHPLTMSAALIENL